MFTLFRTLNLAAAWAAGVCPAAAVLPAVAARAADGGDRPGGRRYKPRDRGETEEKGRFGTAHGYGFTLTRQLTHMNIASVCDNFCSVNIINNH